MRKRARCQSCGYGGCARRLVAAPARTGPHNTLQSSAEAPRLPCAGRLLSLSSTANSGTRARCGAMGHGRGRIKGPRPVRRRHAYGEEGGLVHAFVRRIPGLAPHTQLPHAARAGAGALHDNVTNARRAHGGRALGTARLAWVWSPRRTAAGAGQFSQVRLKCLEPNPPLQCSCRFQFSGPCW